MLTDICDRLGMDVPIFAFSHCRDVVAAVTNAGGIGVLGMTTLSPAALEIDLTWIDNETKGKPYGVDLLLPMTFARPLSDDGGAMAVNRRRHLNSMLAFTSCRRATNATEAPGSSVAATSSRFNASGQRRRLPPACLVSASR